MALFIRKGTGTFFVNKKGYVAGQKVHSRLELDVRYPKDWEKVKKEPELEEDSKKELEEDSKKKKPSPKPTRRKPSK